MKKYLEIYLKVMGIIATIILLLSLSIYFYSKLSGTGTGGAKKLADSYYNDLKEGALEKAVALYSATDEERDKLLQLLKSTDERLGKVKTFVLRDERYNTNLGFGNQKSGTTYTLLFDVDREKFPSVDTIVLQKPLIGGLQILIHNINSKGLLPTPEKTEN